MNGFDRTGRGIGNANEIFLEVLRFSIEKPAHDQIAPVPRVLAFCAVAAYERHALAVRGRHESTALIRLAPRWFGLPACRGNLPQVSFVKRCESNRRTAAIGARHIQILYVRAVPDKRHMLVVG